MTPHLDFDGENILAVDVDSTERPDIPPFGYEIDYLTFGGIYREVALRIVPATFIENIFVRPKDVLSVIIGDNPFSLIGGTGAIWIRTQEIPGKLTLKAIHPSLGAQQVEIAIAASPEEVL